MACCPAHEDGNPSMTAWEGEDGWLHFKCHAGCSEDAILRALGWQMQDRQFLNGKAWPEPQTYYTYRDANGKYLFEKVRKKGKDGKKSFIQQIHDPKTGTVTYSLAALGLSAKMLYNYPAVASAIERGETIYLNEGEKGADSFNSRGYVGTCTPSGASKDTPDKCWLSYHSGMLRNAFVVIVADRDEVGEVYARYVAKELYEVAASVKVVQAKTLEEKADAWDHFNRGGGSVDDFVERPDLLPPTNDTIVWFRDVDVRATEWTWEPYLPSARSALFDAEAGVGKSSVVMAIFACFTTGRSPDGKVMKRPLRCLILGTEDEADDTLLPRFIQFGGDPNMMAQDSCPLALDEAGLERLAKRVRKHRIDVLVIDPLFDYLPAGFNTNAAHETAEFMSRINNFYRDNNLVGIHIRHYVRPTKDRVSKDMGMGSVMWRAKHRTQLTMARSKADPDIRIIRQDKNNLAPNGRNFGFKWERDHFEWMFNHPMLENEGEEKALLTDRAEKMLSQLMVENNYVSANVVMQTAAKEHISWRSVQEARRLLSLDVFKVDGRDVWGFAGYSPFRDF